MAKPYKRPFVSTPANMGCIIEHLVGGADVPLRYFDSRNKKWLQPTESVEQNVKSLGALSLVLDMMDIPQEYWSNAYVIDVQMRISQLWPHLTLMVQDDATIGGGFAYLVNKQQLVTSGTSVEQTYSSNAGPAYYNGPDGKPRRSTYDTDVSKLVIHGVRLQPLYLVDRKGNPLHDYMLKGDNHPEDFAWIVANKDHVPDQHGVLFDDFIGAAKLTGLVARYNEDGEVFFN
jgi:hypothetical protein